MTKPTAEAQASEAQGTPAPSSNDSPPTTNSKKKEELSLSPREWAAKLKTKPERFASADYLHGWSEHAHHYVLEPLKLSEEDYSEAIDVAGKFPTVAPHAKAFGKTVGDKFKDFKPLQSKDEAAKQAAEAAKKGS